jgi:hypothetical protein
LFIGSGVANAATLSISGGASKLAPGETTTISIILNAQGVAVNNAEGVLTYPKDLLSVVSVGKNSSVFTLWVEEPTFSNATGAVTFNGGLPTPGFSGSSGTVLTITMKALQAGQAAVAFQGAAVRANDGLGTDVLAGTSGKTITIGAREPVPTTPAPSAAAISSLRIESPTHPNQDQWYKSRNATLRWSVPMGADAIQVSMSGNASDTVYSAQNIATAEKLFADLNDGVWYFKVRARTVGSWGAPSTYVLRIDGTAPEKRGVQFAYDETARALGITTDIIDITSGIDRYEMYINSRLVQTSPAKDFVDGKYTLPISSVGDVAVRLVAIDRAGNSIDASGSFRALGPISIQLDPVVSLVHAGEQLLLRGRTATPNAAVTIYLQQGTRDPIVVRTTSNSDGVFSTLSPVLEAGDYDVWAQTGADESLSSTAHSSTRVTTHSIVVIGGSRMTVLALAAYVLIALLLLMGAAFYVGRRYAAVLRFVAIRSSLANGDTSSMLISLRVRLEKHLKILQKVRHKRMLTAEEREIKEAIEGDLDHVDAALADRKRSIHTKPKA